MRPLRRDPGLSTARCRQLGLIPPQSAGERRMEEALALAGLRAEAERWIGPYRADFALPAQPPRLPRRVVVEVDGHSRHRTPGGRAHDRRKDAYLRAQGWRVARFPGAAVRRDPLACVRALLATEGADGG